jgi:hypothetical protein
LSLTKLTTTANEKKTKKKTNSELRRRAEARINKAERRKLETIHNTGPFRLLVKVYIAVRIVFFFFFIT